jgi:hypothetical protein
MIFDRLLAMFRQSYRDCWVDIGPSVVWTVLNFAP